MGSVHRVLGRVAGALVDCLVVCVMVWVVVGVGLLGSVVCPRKIQGVQNERSLNSLSNLS